MKYTLMFVMMASFATSVISAAPEPRNFGLKIKVDGKAAYDNDTITQTRKLLVSLSLAGKEPAPKLVVKWTIYGHSRKDHSLVKLKDGEINTSLEGGKSIELSTPEISIKGEREHSVSTGTGRRRKPKKVPASGDEYYGYAVVVTRDSTVVAEAYSRSDLKK